MGRARRRSDGVTEGRATPLNQAIRELTESLGIRKTLGEYDVIVSWKEIVGEGIARVATPVRVEQGVLLVQVSNAAWRGELAMRKLEILDKIYSHAGKRIVRDIRFR